MAQTTKKSVSAPTYTFDKSFFDSYGEAVRTTGKDRAKGVGQVISDVAGAASKGLTDFMSGQKELAEKEKNL